MTNHTCILCGPTPAARYHQERGYTAVQCSGCGLVYVDPRPSETEMKHLYEGQETKVSLTGLTRGVAVAVHNARYDLSVLAPFAPRGRLLEIGCGGGYFLREAKRAGYDVVGMDITRQFVEFGRDVLGLDVREGTMTTLSFPLGTFDVVYHRNVLSHLAHPVEDLRAMRALLRPGGVMMLTTGNVAELPASHWAGTEDLELPDHLFHYGESNLRTLLERSGFEVTQVVRHTLFSQLPLVKKVGRAVKSLGGGKKAAPSAPAEFQMPDRVPVAGAAERVSAFVESFVRYRVGAVLPSAERRCSLTVVARRVEDAAAN